VAAVPIGTMGTKVSPQGIPLLSLLFLKVAFVATFSKSGVTCEKWLSYIVKSGISVIVSFDEKILTLSLILLKGILYFSHHNMHF
jgi:hypothetical protein